MTNQIVYDLLFISGGFALGNGVAGKSFLLTLGGVALILIFIINKWMYGCYKK